MTDDKLVLHPFPTQDSFTQATATASKTLFEKYKYTPQLNQAAVLDAYSFWSDEVARCSRELHTPVGMLEKTSPQVRIPSHLKKAGALTSALNRAKPIKALNKILSYDIEPKSEFRDRIIDIYYNEYFAFEFSRQLILVSDEDRDGLPHFSKFLQQLDLSSHEIYSHELVNDICFYLRSRAPSATSIYMMYKAIYATSHAWRCKQAAKLQEL